MCGRPVCRSTAKISKPFCLTYCRLQYVQTAGRPAGRPAEREDKTPSSFEAFMQLSKVAHDVQTVGTCWCLPAGRSTVKMCRALCLAYSRMDFVQAAGRPACRPAECEDKRQSCNVEAFMQLCRAECDLHSAGNCWRVDARSAFRPLNCQDAQGFVLDMLSREVCPGGRSACPPAGRVRGCEK